MSAVSVASRAGLATILLFSLITIALASAPALPCEFYGTVSIGGNPAPVGTTIVAKMGDQERGQFVLEKEGTLGGSGTFDKRLKVVAEDTDLSGGIPKVSFWVDGQKASPETSFVPGTSNEIILSLGGEPGSVKVTEPVPVSTASTAETPSPTESPATKVTAVPISMPPAPDPSIPVMPVPVTTTSSVETLAPTEEAPAARVTAVPIPMPPAPDPSIPVMPMPEPQPVKPGEISADFSAEPLNGVAPLNVKFTDLSQGIVTLWSWDFGDGHSDLVANPVHVYGTPGNYTVTLTVTNQEGAISTKVRKEYVKAMVEPTPVPTLTVVPVPQVPETFYGTVELYGQPISVGGSVEARVAGYNISSQYNPIKTAKGIFGKTGTFSPKMQIQGIPAGTEIEFYVADEYYSELRAYIKSEDGSLLWTIPYEPGKEKSLNLVATGRQPDVIMPIPVTPLPTNGCAGVPSIPMTFSGDVHITTSDETLLDNSSCNNCDANAQIDTSIEARIEGYDVTGAQNPITMTSAASFGGGNSSWSDKLAVQGRCVPDGSNITFWVTAPNWQVPAQALIRDGSNFTRDVVYAGATENENLHLWVGPIPTVVPTVTPTPTPEAWSPQKFYGKAEFNGYPLRVGDRVMATTEGVDLNSPTNPISVYSFGNFGDPQGNEMLTVEVPYNALNQSDPITFWIKPQGFEYWYKAWIKNPLSSDNWAQSYPFTPGSITNLEISSKDREEFRYFYDIVTTVKNVIMPDDFTGW